SSPTQSAIGGEFVKSLIPGHIPASFPGVAPAQPEPQHSWPGPRNLPFAAGLLKYRSSTKSSPIRQSAIGAEFVKSMIPGHIPASFPGGVAQAEPAARLGRSVCDGDGGE